MSNVHSWYSWSSDNAVTPKWSLVADVFFRRVGAGGAPQQTLLRPGAMYQLTPGARVGGGYAYITTNPYGDDPIPATMPEHRIWEQLMLTQKFGSVGVTHRYRLEQRFIGVGDAADPTKVARFRKEGRFRYFGRAIHDLGRTTGPYLQAYDEVFITTGANTRTNWLDQNRLFLGGGYRFTPTWRLEVGYLEQRIWKSTGLKAERNHTLAVTLFSTGNSGTNGQDKRAGQTCRTNVQDSTPI